MWTQWVFLAWTALAIVIFSIYILFDLYLIIGENGVGYSKDDYIIAAMTLYIDIMRLFMEILRLVGESK